MASDNFKVLTDREHVILRPQMYLGSVSLEPYSAIIDYKYQTLQIVPALLKCVEEIYQNSIDEHIRTNGEYANTIEVDIFNTIEGTEITISDNGRGIPVEPVGDSYKPVLAWTQLRAGSNFDDGGDGRVTAGMNGVGSSLVNIFSTSFVGISSDGKNKCVVTCSNNMSNISYKVSPSKHHGTKVTFCPDLEKFGLSEFTEDHMTVIRDRLNNLSILYPSITFVFNGDKIKFKNIKQVAKNYGDSNISYSDDVMSFIITNSGNEEEFRCLSYVNGIYVKNGGTHIDYLLDKIIQNLREVITKKHKITVLPNQIKQHLLIASWIRDFKNPKFDSQTKERITNTQGEVSYLFNNIDYEKICKNIIATPELIDPIVSAILYKKELEERRLLAKAKKEQDKNNLRSITKFTDATSQKREDCMLMIVEGLSASNSVLSARTPTVGCYPLKGKPINAMGASLSELVQNKEFSDLLAVIGLKIGEPATELRFGKIVITTDSDPDGAGHITGLLIAMFKKFWPELITGGYIYRFVTPLMKVEFTNGKTVTGEKFFYSLDEFDQWTKPNQKYTVRYLKGLGSSTAKDFKNYFSDMDKHLVQLTCTKEELAVVDLVFGKETGSADKRKQWLDLQE